MNMYADSRSWLNVAVVTLGREDVLMDCLDDLVAQNYDRFDITIVDQNPTIDERLLRRSEELGGRLQVLHSLPVNMCTARNLAIENTCGEVVVFLDDDTRLGPDLLKYYSAAFARAKVGGIAGWIDEADPADVWRPSARTVRSTIGCNMAYRRDVIEAVGGWDANFVPPYFHGEETEFAARVVRAGYEIVVCPRALVFHRRFRTGGVRQPKTPEYWHSYITNQVLLFRKSRPLWQWALTPAWLVKFWITVHRLAGGMVTVGGYVRAVRRGFRLARRSLGTKSFLVASAKSDSE